MAAAAENAPASGGMAGVLGMVEDDAPVGEPVNKRAPLNRLSDALYDVKDNMKEGTYIEICKLMQEAHNQNASKPPVAASAAGLQAREAIRDIIMEQMHDVRIANEGLEEQLDAATVTIDRLRDRRRFYSKTTAALKNLCIAKGIKDAEVLDAYDKVGVKDEVLKDRDARKRAREVPNDEEYDLELSE